LIALKMDKPEATWPPKDAGSKHPRLIFINTAGTKGAKLATGKWKMLIVRHALKLKAHAVEMVGVVKMKMEMGMRLS